MFPIYCERCGSEHNSIFEMWGFHREWQGNLAWYCDNCQYGQSIPDTEHIALVRFFVKNGTTLRKYWDHMDSKRKGM